MSDIKDFTALSGSHVEIEAFGVPGTLGRLAAPLANPATLHFAHEAFWIPNPPRTQDLHAGFVADIRLARTSELLLRVIAPAAFRLMVGDRELAWGPLRFAPSMPEYQECRVPLTAGTHRLSLHVIHEGLTTRLAASMPGFAWVQVSGELQDPPAWFGRHLHEYLSTGLRVSPLQGWMEWTCNARAGQWRKESPACDPGWQRVTSVTSLEKILGPACASPMQLPFWPSIELKSTGHGLYRDTFFCYRFDDPAVEFMLADPAPDPATEPDGTWHRFDLGRIRIGALELDIESDGPGEATLAYAERLGPDGRPTPIIAGSTGSTRFLQKYAFGSGRTEIRPLQTLGARFLEVRLACTGRARILQPRFRERDFLGEPSGELSLPDAQLNRIWQVGLDTMRATTEDSAVDSIRERGEWIGDMSLIGVELMAVGWNNLLPARRALYHCAANARSDGMVAGCGPGELIYLGTYAAQWISACLRCAELEGHLGLLKDLEEPARLNLQAILNCLGEDGHHRLPWCFLDWGYERPAKNQIEPAVLAHVVTSVEAWIQWQSWLGRTEITAWIEQAKRLKNLLREYLRIHPPAYHDGVLGERIGLVKREIAVNLALQQLHTSFPYNPAGRRLRDPTRASSEIATPYFTAYSIDLLLRAGRAEEAMEIWRKSWGWMLENGATTWWEVFDERWSQCHYWAGAPTWQMTRRILGVDPTLHQSRPVIRLAVYPGDLPNAKGRAAFPGVGWTDVRWQREKADILFEVKSPAPWTLLRDGKPVSFPAGVTELRLQRAATDPSFVP
jgi:hypothetical protein